LSESLQPTADIIIATALIAEPLSINFKRAFIVSSVTTFLNCESLALVGGVSSDLLSVLLVPIPRTPSPSSGLPFLHQRAPLVLPGQQAPVSQQALAWPPVSQQVSRPRQQALSQP
jgi:hypothetical protein